MTAPLLEDVDATPNASQLVEATASPRGPVFDAAREYIDRGYSVVLLHGVEGTACTCWAGTRCTSPGKHPIANNWQKQGVRTIEDLRRRWDERRGKPTNIGILLDRADRLVLIDLDVRDGKGGDRTLAEWSRQVGIDFTPFLTQHTPSGGRHFVFRIPGEEGVDSLPNRPGVAPGIDVLRHAKQFVVSPSVVRDGRRYHAAGAGGAVALPPIDQLPSAPPALLAHLRALGGDRARTRDPVDDLEALQAPSVDKVRGAVSHIPNTEEVDRGQYVWMAYRILAACGRQHESEARTIFLDWAGDYPGADPDEDARVFDTLDWQRVEGGWDDLWHLAAKHGYDASAEVEREAQEAFSSDPSAVHEANTGAGRKRVPRAVALAKAIRANSNVEWFHARRGKRPYARIRFRERWQTHSLDSDIGTALLRHVVTGADLSASPQTFNEALQLLRGWARFDAPARDVFLRVGRVGDRVYIDLGDATFRAIEVTAEGWRLIDEPPVLFVRSEAMEPLPEPSAGGSVEDFVPFFPTRSEDDLRLLLTFMVDTLLAPDRSARPILAFDGPPGSAKTTMTGFVKSLTDPQVGGLSAPSQNERDLVIAGRWSHVVAFDNASTLSLALSDALCRLTTGGGLRVRRLYTDEGETIFDELRHVVLNSIGDVAKQADLRDRCLFVSASPPSARRDDDELSRAFEDARPHLLGVLLQAVAKGLANEAGVDVAASELPRMAGFARRGAACAPALGWSAARFLSAYQSNIDQAALDFAEDDLVSHALLARSWRGARAWLEARMRERGTNEQRIAALREEWADGVVWRGAAADLLAYLEDDLGSTVTKKAGWPRDVRWFGRLLKMSAEALRRAGWLLEPTRSGRERLVIIRRLAAWAGAAPDLDDYRPRFL